MKVLIEIPEELYKALLNGYEEPYSSMFSDVIKNGTPLPKRHGRLIDADVLGEKLNRYTEAPYQYALAAFNESPTIIEAEREDKE